MKQSRNPVIFHLLRIDNIVAGVFLGMIFLDVMMQIISRVTPGNAISWTVEVGEMLLGAVIWIGIGPAVLSNSHVRFDLLLNKVPLKGQRVLFVFGNLTFASFLSIMAFYTINLLSFYLKTNSVTTILRWNKFWVRLPMFVGCIIGIIRMLMQACDFATGKRKLPSEETAEALEAIKAKKGDV
ncbi:TRAP transporter small permease [Treponema primitia]|uniref:TRAP transporter small permease n=1 Tax=Treponema primitia TaxID=88058 RepID=UPI00398098DE